MKKPVLASLLILAGMVVGVIVSSLIFAASGYSIFNDTLENNYPSDEEIFWELSAQSQNILEHIRDGDYARLSEFVHPEYGVIFSPHATISLTTNRRFTADQVAAFGTDTTVYMWGVFNSGGNGNGGPIEMTPGEYFEMFVFDKDYTTASAVGVNNIVRSGNALENITDVFPNIQFIDFHMPEEQQDWTEDFAWSSLRLGFEEYNESLYLTVIARGEWTP